MADSSRKRARGEPELHGEARHGTKVIAIAFIMTMAFVFGSALLLMAVAAHSCVVDHSCGQLDGLSHVITAWTGAVIAGALGYLFGSNGRNIL